LTLGDKAATYAEHMMTILEGVWLYPKAIGWSVSWSLATVIEGYKVGWMAIFWPTSAEIWQAKCFAFNIRTCVAERAEYFANCRSVLWVCCGLLFEKRRFRQSANCCGYGRHYWDHSGMSNLGSSILIRVVDPDFCLVDF
jgi:hypothetical protein